MNPLAILVAVGAAGFFGYSYYKRQQLASLVSPERDIPVSTTNTDATISEIPLAPSTLGGRNNPINIHWPATINDLGVQAICNGIANAEGFFASGNPRPKRNHNPGDLRIPLGAGNVKAYDPAGIILAYVPGLRDGYVVYETDNDGWNDLKKQVTLMLNGESSYYGPDMTLSQVSRIYTQSEQDAWARNCARGIGDGISTENTLREIYMSKRNG